MASFYRYPKINANSMIIRSTIMGLQSADACTERLTPSPTCQFICPDHCLKEQTCFAKYFIVPTQEKIDNRYGKLIEKNSIYLLCHHLHPGEKNLDKKRQTMVSDRSQTLRGGIAQLGERLNGIQEVSGSIPLTSTTSFFLTFFLFCANNSIENWTKHPVWSRQYFSLIIHLCFWNHFRSGGQ